MYLFSLYFLENTDTEIKALLNSRGSFDSSCRGKFCYVVSHLTISVVKCMIADISSFSLYEKVASLLASPLSIPIFQ